MLRRNLPEVTFNCEEFEFCGISVGSAVLLLTVSKPLTPPLIGNGNPVGMIFFFLKKPCRISSIRFRSESTFMKATVGDTVGFGTAATGFMFSKILRSCVLACVKGFRSTGCLWFPEISFVYIVGVYLFFVEEYNNVLLGQDDILFKGLMK